MSGLIEKIDELGFRYLDHWYDSIESIAPQFLYWTTYHHFTFFGCSPEEEKQFWSSYNNIFLIGKLDTLLIKPATPEVAGFYESGADKDDSGFDLFCPETISVKPGETVKIDFQISCQANSAFLLMPRSSIVKTPLRLANSVGLIDRGYRGSICAVVDHIKSDEKPFVIEKGTRLFQLVFPSLTPIQPLIVQELSTSARGTGGFGSTGK